MDLGQITSCFERKELAHARTMYDKAMARIELFLALGFINKDIFDLLTSELDNYYNDKFLKFLIGEFDNGKEEN